MEKQDLLDSLIKRNEELKPIVFVSFKTSRELNNHRKKNQELYDEYFDNLDKINELKWELMTPEERAIKEEQRRLSKLKREGKLGA